ncbi:hypothetical protein ACFQY5_38015 [Paeniroseomonas aquatica]|uniref:Uncharacterized protein n=1 Tax=Paeniroseomonas aquatica TaxID=373043 RepID=A0ABT8A316_9PROT|nr:hypothetical protein [Paeniroseomonas aquatica]MDN3564144.1 hypothetical protein [Paeniroseomonas aquatica]
MKTQILTAIGEQALQPRAALHASLAANDRLKYIFSLLQVAADHAAHPETLPASLKDERVACGIDQRKFDTITAGVWLIGDACQVPGAERLMARIASDLGVMAAPLLTTPLPDLAGRLASVLHTLPTAADDLLRPNAIAATPRPATAMQTARTSW